MIDDRLSNGVRLGFDALSISVLLGTIADMLPPLAALLTVVWTLIQIWETKTVGRLVGRSPKHAAELAAKPDAELD